MTNQHDVAMKLVERRLDAYDAVILFVLSAEPTKAHRKNGAYVEGWNDALEAVAEVIRAAVSA